MTNNTITARYYILGLLSQQPMSGYDIKRLLKSLSWLIGSPSFGSLYPALRGLLQDDLVTVESIPRQNRQPRKIYSITPAGERFLDEWIHQPLLVGASTKAFVMRLLLATHLSHEGLMTHLRRRYQQVAGQQAALRQAISETDRASDSGQRLAFDYGMNIASTELAWLKDAPTPALTQ